MIKLKKIDKYGYVAHHEVTGEPIAKVKKGHDEWSAYWHPHAMDMHPAETADILNSIKSAKTADGIATNIHVAVNALKDTSNIGAEIEHNFEHTSKTGEKLKSHVIHFIDKDTNKKIFTVAPYSIPNFLAQSEYSKNAPLVHLHQGTDAGLEIAEKSIHLKRDRYSSVSSTNTNLDNYKRLAAAHLKTLSGDGPRFVGHKVIGAESHHQSYSTKIENPRAAIDEYIKTAIPDHEKLTSLHPAPNVSLLKSEDGKVSHIINHTPGLISHTKVKLNSSESPLSQVYEEWAGLDRNPSQSTKDSNAKLAAIWKKTAEQPISDYINSIDSRSGTNQYSKIKEILHKQNDGTPEAQSGLDLAKKLIKNKNFNRSNT
jgi:hypothetical protein